MARRLYEIAKELGIKDVKLKEFVQELRQQGFDEIKDHLSQVDETQERKIVDYVKNRMTGGIQEKRISSTVKRRRRKVVSKTTPKTEPRPTPSVPNSLHVSKPQTEVKPAVEPAEIKEKEVAKPVAEPPAPVPEPQTTEDKPVVTPEETPQAGEKPAVEEVRVKAEPEPKESEVEKNTVEKSEKQPEEQKQPEEKAEPVVEPVKKQPVKEEKEEEQKPPEMERDERGIPVMKGLRIISKPDEKEVAELAARRAKEAAEKARRKAEAEEARRKAKKKGKVAERTGKEEPASEDADKRGKKKRKKGRRVIYDKKRDVIAIHDIDGDQFEELKPPRPAPRRKKTKEKKKFAKTKVIAPKAEKRVIKIEGDSISVGELARRIGVKASSVVKKLMSMGVMAGVNQPLDMDTAEILASEFEYTIERIGFDMEAALGLNKEDKPESLRPRPPVVTVMGHVDHGKTTLLDRIRNSRIVDSEAGQITQHIGAYVLDLPKGRIVWLDTPGHEAFTAMRARGALATDIVVLVVAADDGVKAQTIEAINHAKDAGVPVVVAINKIDKPTAQPDVVKKQLADHELIPEEWGGDTVFVKVSAKTGSGVEDLLDAILLQAEVSELKANPDKPASGVVVESTLDEKKGPVATLLVREGTLHKGDIMVVGTVHGRARLMLDDRGRPMNEAGPSIPAQVAGWDAVPQGAEKFYVVPDEKTAKQVISYVKERSDQAQPKARKMSLEDLFAMAEKGETKEFKIVLKTDVQGSLEAVRQAIEGIEGEKIRPTVIHSGVGDVTSNDINLASAAGAVVLTFNAGIDNRVMKQAEQEKVQVRIYDVIYDLLDDLKKAMLGELQPEVTLVLSGRAEVRQVFKLSKQGRVAGCMVTEGKVVRGSPVKVIRGDTMIAEDTLSGLKRFKDDVKEVAQGYECGISLSRFGDFQEGDIIEVYRKESVEQEL